MDRVAVPTLHLSVQYASASPAPRRDQVRRWVQAALRAIGSPTATLAVRFVDEAEARALNREYRRRDYATNVLTFAYPEVDAIAGDIVICLPVVEAEARAQGKPVLQHCAHLTVHGTLHASGRDHENPKDADAMETLERTVLARFGIVDPYRPSASEPG